MCTEMVKHKLKSSLQVEDSQKDIFIAGLNERDNLTFNIFSIIVK